MDEFFNACKKKDGTIRKYSQCKTCTKETSKAWSKNNKEHIKEINKIWYENNKERIKEASKIWRKNNKEHIKEINKIWYENNKERIKEKNKKYIKEIMIPYIIQRLCKNKKISRSIIKQYPELIETYKIILKTKRLWKTSQI